MGPILSWVISYELNSETREFNTSGGEKKVSTYVLLSIHIFCTTRINPLPDDKTLDWSKLKAFAEDKIKVNEKF